MKRFVTRRLVSVLCATGMLGLTSQTMAAAFQLWEQSAANVANYHAGYAAITEDASTAFFNPAGLLRFKTQQMVVGMVVIPTSFKFRGTIGVSTIEGGEINSVTAQGGRLGFIPNLHYVAPINDRVAFGFSIAVPFGLKTDYGRETILRYNATLTSVAVVDVSPSLGIKIYDGLSLGAGFDVQFAKGDFNLVAVLGDSDSDTDSKNRASGTGYGYHLGALYEFTPEARVGLSYHSKVNHHLTGTSKFVGPIAQGFNDLYHLQEGNAISTDNAKVNVTLPAYTALSGYYRIWPKLAVMGSIIYTQWNCFKTLRLQNLAGVDTTLSPTRDLTVIVPENYRNSWNGSVGIDYDVNEKLMLRTGGGFDQTPVQDRYRNVQLPDNSRYTIAMGGRYHASKTVAVDLGWTHFFMKKAVLNPLVLNVGIEEVTTEGTAKGGADVYGAQITWDIV